MEVSSERPLPRPTEASRPYWEACRNHELWLQRCASCGAYRFPAGFMCPDCSSLDLAWQRVSGRGKIYTYTVVHRAPHPALAGEAPYAVALIELDEGPCLMSNIVGCPSDDVRIDMAVEVVFRDMTPSVTLPLFRPVVR